MWGDNFNQKQSHPPEGNKLKVLTDGNKGKASKTKNYRGKKPRNKPSPDPEANTNFQGRRSG